MEVEDSQNVTAPSFIGSATSAQKLRPKERFKPDALQAHIDGGNTRSDDLDGPLGNSPVVSSTTVTAAWLYWESSTSLVSALSCSSPKSSVAFCLAALDPDTLEVLAQWSQDDRTTVSNYWQVVDGKIVMPTLEGYVVVVEKVVNGSDVSFRTVEETDLSNHMATGSILALAGYTDDDNLWFAATPAPLIGLDGKNVTTVGYIDTDGGIHSIELNNQIIENGMAVNGKIIYVLTGPGGSEDRPDAVGHFYAFQAADEGGVKIAWNETYSAGSGIKPGGLSRGSGSTPGLLGSKYVAMTDNADTQINLNVYLQAEEMGDKESSFVCSLPLFHPNASGNEAALTTHYDGTTYSATITNCYGFLTFKDSDGDLNGSQNNLSVTAPGVSRVWVTEDGECSLMWDLGVVATMTTLSTTTGLLYLYTQDYDLAIDGEYVWYIAAFNYTTGDEVWRSRIGAGGNFYPDVSHIQLGPNGRVYEGVTAGMTWLEDA